MSDNLICIRSYLMVWEADWQRSLLADAGVRSCADNSAIVLWAWHYTQAVGGVKLYVDSAQLDLAVDVLAGTMREDRALLQDEPNVRSCPQCGAELPADWDECWRCASAPEASVELATEHQSEPEDSPQTARPIAAALLLTWAVISHGIVFGAELFALIVAAHFVVGNWAACASSPSEEADPKAALPDPPRRSEVAESMALRVWHAAVLGFMWFPPLLLYALYLLVRLGWRRFELSPRGRARHRGAIAALFLSLLRWGALFLAFYHP